jgi:hypothetical protein
MLAPEEQAACLKSLDQVRLASEHYLDTHRNLRQLITFVANLQEGVSRAHQSHRARCAGGNFRIARQLQSRPTGIVQSLQAHVASTQALSQGSVQAYENQGFNSSPYELRQAVLMALSKSVAETRWYAGEAVFEETRTR